MTERKERFITECEARVCNLAIEWLMARYAIAEALIEAEFKQQIRLLIKERREVELKKSEKG